MIKIEVTSYHYSNYRWVWAKRVGTEHKFLVHVKQLEIPEEYKNFKALEVLYG